MSHQWRLLSITKEVSKKGRRYLQCMQSAGLELHLASLKKSSPGDLASGPQFVGNNIVHHTAKIGKDCKIGPNVSIGIECEIGDGARITSSVLLHRVHVSIFGFFKLCIPYPFATASNKSIRIWRLHHSLQLRKHLLQGLLHMVLMLHEFAVR